MSNKFFQSTALFLGLFITLNVYAGNDRIMNYLNGSNIGSTTALTVMDQQFAGFFLPTVTTEIHESFITATLRYEESLLPEFGMGSNTVPGEFHLKVTYSIDLTDVNHNVITFTNQVLDITYDEDEGLEYNDIDVIRYKGYLKGEITITNVLFEDLATSPASISTNYIPEDVYLELSSDVERYYQLQNPAPWSVNHGTLTNNELPITWKYVLGAESFDVEWVFVDITGTAIQIQQSAQTYDWRNATRINTTNNFYNISMAFPKGMLVYRVRPVGVDLNYGNHNLLVYGDWSDPGTTTVASSAYSAGNGYVYDTGLNVGKNWTYNVAYAEDGKRKEGISYIDGSGRSRQEVTIINSDENAIVGETVYDFEGRPAVTMLPTPVTSVGMDFYERTNNDPFNDYDKYAFDRDNNIGTSGPDAMAAASLTNKYYSSSTSSTSLFKDYVPDAENYPFSRTVYKRDGTDRIKEQSGVGLKLRQKAGNTTKYYYGTPTDMEIERLFGNEVGPNAYYQKNMIKDANEQVTVQYLDKEGRTIATALAGQAPTPLLNVDYQPSAVTIKADLMTNNYLSANSSTTTHVLTLGSSSNVTFDYTLTAKDFTKACLDSFMISSINPFNCKYTLEIKVLDEDGNDLVSPVISYPTASAIASATESFTLSSIGPGTFTVVKTLRVDEIKADEYADDFEQAILDDKENINQDCVPYNPPADVSCNSSCTELCEAAFKETYYDEASQQNVTIYYDQEGNTGDQNGDYDINDYNTFVNNCKDACNEADELALDICALKLETMKGHMSPGGQYFDNLPSKYQDNNSDGIADLDANGNPIISTSYDKNDWLKTTFGSNPYTATYPNSSLPGTIITSSYTDWDDVRDDWEYLVGEGILNELVKEHPEYCAYQFNCIDDISTPECSDTYPSGTNPEIDRSHLIDYNFHMMSGGSVYADREKQETFTNPTLTRDYMDFMNPIGFSDNTTDNGAANDNQQYINEVDATLDDPSGSSFLTDPLYACTLLTFTDPQGSSKNVKTWMQDRLKKFIAVDAGGTKYHSIWYVIEDKGNVTGSATKPPLMTQDAFDFYNNLHGNSNLTTPVVGILDKSGTDPSKQNKYQFFRSVYKFYRDFILYQLFKEDDNACPDVDGDGQRDGYDYWDVDVVKNSNASWPNNLDLASYNSTRDVDDTNYPGDERDYFSLVWPRILPYDILEVGNLTNMIANISSATGNVAQVNCEADCDNNAQAWLNEYSACIDAWVAAGSGLNASQETQLIGELKADLKEICKLGCAPQTPAAQMLGSSDGDGSTNLNAVGLTAPSLTDYHSTGLPTVPANLATFDELVAYYDSYFGTSCSASPVYPNTVTNVIASNSDCNCDQLTGFADSNSIAYTNYSSLATTFNSHFGTSYTATDVERWSDYCNGEVGDIKDYPAEFECIDCKCENLAIYILANHPTYDPYNLSTGASGEADDVANDINTDFFGGTPTITHSQVTAMMTQCTAGNNNEPNNYLDNPNFENLPDIFRCTSIMETTNPDDDCASELNNDLLIAYNIQWDQLMQNAKNQFRTDYLAKCMEDMNTRETFTAEYELNEFMYTLYYYDQAGNLIKTVPPEGVIPNSTGSGNPFTPDPFFADVKEHRTNPYDATSNPTGKVHQNVDHTLVTQYKYDSYNNLIWQSTPDGGITEFWYDELGRLVLSQNAKQKADGTSLSTYIYSYTLYDNLGRIEEVGELSNTTDFDETTNLTSYPVFKAWVRTCTQSQVTYTVYDEKISTTVSNHFTTQTQDELRTRVASILREETPDFDVSNEPILTTYDFGTHFSYDIHGNVKEIVLENNDLTVTSELDRVKRITYEYDLISGNVNKVNYQPGSRDQFYHRYCYDADNRITKVETSRDNYIWDTDAKYFYYEHGPLARMEVGEKQVAGTDYAYTLQGWIKGVNSNTLTASLDVGKDANIQATGLNSHFATDAYSYSLGYFEDDYTAVDETYLENMGTSFNNAGPNLYNGNIRHMVTNLLNTSQDNDPIPMQGTAYKYDQANRIRSSRVYAQHIIGSGYTDMGSYATEYHYDLNGNITQLKRNNSSIFAFSQKMDDLEYKYANDGNGRNEHDGHTSSYDYRDGSSPTTNKNQLTAVVDNEGVVNVTDIGSSGSGNYVYDEIGQLTEDGSENIDEIVWDVYNKIKEIKYDGVAEPNRADILFKYDGSGNRIAKILKTKTGGSINNANEWDYYFYERDASGNIMAVYQQDIAEVSSGYYKSTLKQIQKDIYGSSRLGTDNLEVVKETYFCATFNTTGATATTCGTNPNYSTNSLVEVNSNEVITIKDESLADLNITIKANSADVVLNITPTYTVTSGSLGADADGNAYVPKNQSVTLEIDGDNFTANVAGHGAYFVPNNGNTLKYSAAGPINISLPPTGLNFVNEYSRTMAHKVYEKSNHLGNVMVTLSDRKQLVKGSEISYFYNFENSNDNEVNGSGINPITNNATYVSSVSHDGSDVIETNTNNGVIFSDDARLDFGANNFTVAVWTYRVSQITWGNFIVNKWNSSNFSGTNEWLLHFAGGINGNTSGPIFGVESGSNQYYVSSPTVLNSSQWYFIVGKREGDKIKVYVDGVLKGTTSLPSSTTSINNVVGRELLIGMNDNAQYSNMRVDNLMIFEEALSDDQIASLYDQTLYSHYEPDVLSYSDYYPFGSLMPGRNSNSGAYRYAFNGMEQDDEVKNITGAHYNFGARVYDSRIGKWFSTDNVFKANLSPYQFGKDNPLYFIDPDGNDEYYFLKQWGAYYNLKQYRELVNGKLTFFIPQADDITKKSGSDKFFFVFGGTQDYPATLVRIHSPLTIKGGDGNLTPRQAINRKTNKAHLFIENGIDAYIEKNKPISLFGEEGKLAHFAIESSPGGAFDYKAQLLNDALSETSLYEIDEIYYNKNEAGNFLWGYTGAALGYDLKTLEAGAETLIQVEGRMDSDEKWEVEAYKKGFYYYHYKVLGNEDYKELYENTGGTIDYNENTIEPAEDEGSQ